MMDALMEVHVPSNVPMKYTPFKGMEFKADDIKEAHQQVSH